MDKRYLKNIGIYAASTLLSVFLIAYIVYHLVNSFSSDVDTMAADIVTVSESFTSEAYIFRNEEVLISDTTGNVNYLLDDGTRVAKNTQVAEVYESAGSDDNDALLGELEKQITILENSTPKGDWAMSDSSGVDSQIDSLYYTIRGKIDDGELDYVFRRKDELLTFINKKQMIIDPSLSFDGMLDELKRQKAELTTSNDGTPVYNEQSGYFYSEVDGYESIFTADAVENLTLNDFYKIIESDPDNSMEGVVAKVATSYNWYIALEAPAVHQQYYNVGNSYEVNFPYSGGQTVPMKLYRIITDSESENVVLVFETGNIPEDFNYLRKQTVEIVQQSYTGYRVPSSAVRMVDSKQGVYIKSGNVVKFKEIVPLVEVDGYFIVKEQDKLNDKDYESKLGMYDLVIVKGKNLYEGKIIE